jgi:hypothetical protein
MKVRQISSEQDIDSIIQSLDLSAERAVSQIGKAITGVHAMQALWSMKFSSIGCDPLSVDTPLNLIEQVNQTFTYLASARAVRLLFRLHPELAPFTVNLGTAKGSDIESAAQGGLAAEVFAAVRPTNNHTLAKDLRRSGERLLN